MEHKCKKLKESKEGMYGGAVCGITFDKKLNCWTMDNGEYMSYPIIACPFCGEYLIEEELKQCT